MDCNKVIETNNIIELCTWFQNFINFFHQFETFLDVVCWWGDNKNPIITLYEVFSRLLINMCVTRWTELPKRKRLIITILNWNEFCPVEQTAQLSQNSSLSSYLKYHMSLYRSRKILTESKKNSIHHFWNKNSYCLRHQSMVKRCAKLQYSPMIYAMQAMNWPSISSITFLPKKNSSINASTTQFKLHRFSSIFFNKH